MLTMVDVGNPDPENSRRTGLTGFTAGHPGKISLGRQCGTVIGLGLGTEHCPMRRQLRILTHAYHSNCPGVLSLLWSSCMIVRQQPHTAITIIPVIMALVDLLLPRMSGSVGLAVLLLLLVVLFFVINSVTSTPHPPGVPLIREPPGATRFSLRTRLAYYTDYQNILQEAYDDVCSFPLPIRLIHRQGRHLERLTQSPSTTKSESQSFCLELV